MIHIEIGNSEPVQITKRINTIYSVIKAAFTEISIIFQHSCFRSFNSEISIAIMEFRNL